MLKHAKRIHDGAGLKGRGLPDSRRRDGRLLHVRSCFLEPVYQEALEIELARRNIPFEAQKLLKVEYKGQSLKKEYVADFVCFEQVIIEVKACQGLTAGEEGQLINYMKATQMHVGLLINFCSQARLEWKRYVI